TPPPVLYTLSLHDALPIYARAGVAHQQHLLAGRGVLRVGAGQPRARVCGVGIIDALALAHGIERQHQEARASASIIPTPHTRARSEEHTSELQSLRHLVCR